MIARFRIIFPFPVHVAISAQLPAWRGPPFDKYTAIVYPPSKSALLAEDVLHENDNTWAKLVEKIMTSGPAILSKKYKIDGEPCVLADVLQIDFIASEFERRHEQNADDPPVGLAFWIANDVIARLRTVSGAALARVVDPGRTFWTCEYLDDEGVRVCEDKTKYRWRGGGQQPFGTVPITSYLWDAAAQLPENTRIDKSEALLLDAYNLLPETGPAIVLAYSAIETKTVEVLKVLGSRLVDRVQNIPKCIDVLMREVSGKSLKDEDTLWQVFQYLREARHSFVHEGEVRCGNQPLRSDGTRRLIDATRPILAWLNERLPLERRPPQRTRIPNLSVDLFFIGKGDPKISIEAKVLGGEVVQTFPADDTIDIDNERSD
ncbi:MAG TPA: hypothetical protein VFF06_18350 [Polyangia bacterium]|nr:hypothetical protein [Polyangia bacterium]